MVIEVPNILYISIEPSLTQPYVRFESGDKVNDYLKY
jgi:hypothetical protein